MTWLSAETTWQYTALVIGISIALSLFLALCDYLFITLLGLLLVR